MKVVGGGWESAISCCYDDGKALDSCLLQRAEAATVGAVFNLPPPLPDALVVEKAGTRSRSSIFKLISEGVCRRLVSRYVAKFGK